MKIKRQNGASLLEVMIALFVLGVGLLGVLAMQAESMKLNQQAYSSTQAMFLANDAIERMRVNRVAVSQEDFETLSGEALTAELFPDLSSWNEDVVSESLPGGRVAIDRVAEDETVFKVTVTFPQQSLANEQLTEASRDIDYVLFARL